MHVTNLYELPYVRFVVRCFIFFTSCATCIEIIISQPKQWRCRTKRLRSDNIYPRPREFLILILHENPYVVKMIASESEITKNIIILCQWIRVQLVWDGPKWLLKYFWNYIEIIYYNMYIVFVREVSDITN